MLEQLLAEPRWLAIVGLGLDLVGAILVAGTAWFRVATISAYGGPGGEPEEMLKKRRWFVLIGGFLLASGFALQMYGTWAFFFFPIDTASSISALSPL